MSGSITVLRHPSTADLGNVGIFTSEDIHRLGPAEVGRQAGEWASKGCDYYYMTLDIDVIDAGLSPGTGSVTIGAVPTFDLMLYCRSCPNIPSAPWMSTR